MSLSSSIEFEPRSRNYRGQTSGDTEAYFGQGNSRVQPPRVRYPTPDYEDERSIEDTRATTTTLVITQVKSITEENCFAKAPFVYNPSQRTSSPYSPPPNDSRFSASSIATATTRSTVPLNYRISDEEFPESEEIDQLERSANGASIAIPEDDDDIREIADDGSIVASKKQENSEEIRQPDRFGFLGGTGREVTIPVEVFRRRESKWLSMLSNWEYHMTKRFDKVKSRCRKGIPSSIRPRAWKYLCGAQFFMTSAKTKHLFQTLDAQEADQHWDSEINKDLNRQYPNHELFSQSTPYGKFGQRDLYRVLKAWTLLHPDEGYCQAQAPIAAALLMHMPAEEAFFCFAQICQKYLPGYYSPGLEVIQLDGDILFGLLKKHSYSSYKHLKKQNIDPVLYMVEWFMCIFCRTLPWPCVLRVLDMFFCEGVKVLFKVGVFLFKYGLSSREQLKACPTMYETVERLRHLPIENLNEEYLDQKVAEMNISDEDLERVHFKLDKARKKQKQQKSHVTM